MVQHMHNIVLEATIFAIIVVRYISLTCDEVSLIDTQSWLLVHAYVVQNWLCIPILFYFEHVVVGLGVDNLI